MLFDPRAFSVGRSHCIRMALKNWYPRSNWYPCITSWMWYIPENSSQIPSFFMSLWSLNKNDTHFLGRLLVDLPHETRFLRSWHTFPSTRLLQATTHCQKVAEIGPFDMCIFLQSPPQTSITSGAGSPSECHRSLMLCAYHLCWSSCRVPRVPRSSPWRLGVGDTVTRFSHDVRPQKHQVICCACGKKYTMCTPPVMFVGL